MRHHRLPELLLVLGLLLAPSILLADTGGPQSIALSADGKIWKLQSGPYGELFPGSRVVAAEHLVLALDEIGPDGLGKRWLVPETEAAEGEFSPGLIYEETTHAVFLIWESLLPNAYSRLLLTSLQSEGWSDVIEITGNPFSRKGSPQLQVTRDSGLSTGSDGQRVWTTIHLSWWEDAAIGKTKRYAPIVLIDGAFVGWAPVYDLGVFLPAAPERPDSTSPSLEQALTLQRGVDGRSVVIGFFDPSSSQLASVEIQALPSELAELAEAIREAIITFHANEPTLNASQLADKARAHIIHIGSKFHAATITYLSEQIAALILAEAPAHLASADSATIADKARAHIIHIGAKLKAGGLESVEPWHLVEIGQTSLGGAPYQLLKVAPIGSWALPDVGGAAHLFLSESGRHALLAWPKEEHVLYRESLEDGGWSDTQQILLGETLNLDMAFAMLANRVKSR